MPYKSDAQRKFMHAKHPEIAKRWDKKYGGATDGQRAAAGALLKKGKKGK